MSEDRTMKKHTAVWILGVVLLAGCGGESPPPEESASAPAPAEIEITPALQAKLAGADLMDGTEDKVVSRCTGCGLAMEGSDEHTVAVGDYELHFCSESCRDNVTDEAILALVIPEEQAQEEAR
jgi:hypothetical protein